MTKFALAFALCGITTVALIIALCLTTYRAGYVDGMAAAVNFASSVEEKCEVEKRIITLTRCHIEGTRL